MKIFKPFLPVIAFFTIFACNETPGNSKDNVDEVKTDFDEREVPNSSKENINAVVDTLSFAIINPDRVLLEEITADELTYGHSSGLVQNKEEFIDDLLNGSFDFSSITLTDQSIHIKGETAVVRQIFSAEATNMGDAVSIRIGNVLVYHRQDDQWKLLARQAFKL